MLKNGANPNLIHLDKSENGYYLVDYFDEYKHGENVKRKEKTYTKFLKYNAVSGYYFIDLMTAIYDLNTDNDNSFNYYLLRGKDLNDKNLILTDTFDYVINIMENRFKKGLKLSDIENYYGVSPLETSIYLKNNILTKFFIENGANVNNANVIYNLCEICDTIMIKYFIEKGADFQNNYHFINCLTTNLSKNYIDSLIDESYVDPGNDIDQDLLKYLFKFNHNIFLKKILIDNPKYGINKDLTNYKNNKTKYKLENSFFAEDFVLENKLDFAKKAVEQNNVEMLKYIIEEIKLVTLDNTNYEILKSLSVNQDITKYIDSYYFTKYFTLDSVAVKATIFGGTNMQIDRRVLLTHRKFDFIIDSEKYKIISSDSFPEYLIDTIKNCEPGKNITQPVKIVFNNGKSLDFNVTFKVIDTLKTENMALLCGKYKDDLDIMFLKSQTGIDCIFADSLSEIISYDIQINNKKIGTFKSEKFTPELLLKFENLQKDDSLKILNIRAINSKSEVFKLNDIKVKITLNQAYFCYGTIGGKCNTNISQATLMAQSFLKLKNNIYNLKVKSFEIDCDIFFGPIVSTSATITPKQKELIGKLKTGGKVLVENIIVVSPEGEEYKLPDFYFRLN